MTPLVTIMIMFIGEGGAFMTSFDSQRQCSAALLEFSAIADDLAKQYDGEIWARCVKTSAPSASIRPQARPIDT